MDVGEPAQELAVLGQLGAAASALTSPSIRPGSPAHAATAPGRRIPAGPATPGARTSADWPRCRPASPARAETQRGRSAVEVLSRGQTLAAAARAFGAVAGRYGCRTCHRTSVRVRSEWWTIRTRRCQPGRRLDRVRASSRRAPWSASRSPIAATVFREGHDAVGASVVLARRRRPARRPGHRMHPGAPGTDRWHADVVADQPGTVDLRGRGVERPVGDLAPRGDRQDRRRPGRGGSRQRPRDRRAAVRPARPYAAQAGERQRAARRRARRCATPPSTSPHRVAPALDEYLQRLVAREPGARTGHQLAALPALGRPAARAVRLLVRVLPPLDRRRAGRRPGRAGPPGAARHVQGRHRAPDYVASTWASTSSTCRRSTRSAR